MAEKVYSFEKNKFRDAKLNKKNDNLNAKIAKHRTIRAIEILVLLIFVAVVVLVCVYKWNTRVFTGYEVIRTNEIQWVSSAENIEFDGTVLKVSKDGVSCTDQEGNVIWNQTYQMQNPMVSINGDKVAIGDYNGRTIYVCSSTTIMGNISTNLPIRSFTVSEEGIVATVLEDQDISWISVFTVDGKNPVTAKTQMKNSGYPLQLAFSPNSDLLAVSYLYIDEGKVTSRIAFYNFGDVGQNYQDRLVSAYEYQDTIVPQLYFLDASTCVAVGNNRIMFYQGSQIPKSFQETILQEEIQTVFHSGEYVALTYYNDDLENRYRMEIYGKEGKVVQDIVYPFECTNFLENKDWFVLYNKNACKIITLQGKEKLNMEFTQDIHLILPTDYTYKYTFLTVDGLQAIELQ